ncbi:TrkA family potassium uptake protein [Mesoplasma syrphidae]|uniref:TrkA family potassium uptake protein n=1 Tax=Mesoplasma syrphidae TaxID=225999 RepID=A0A2K9CDS5_9MOLU|nr:TrkA family potassium uptake protein [Mesoplasma syrphidae]AUF83804.1 TrkA family potassium uptake protein [Mesoplasma syrphidae]
MAKKKSFAIIGASNFSLAVLTTLVDKRQSITMFDIDQDRLNLYLAEFDSVDAIVLDSTNKMGLAKAGVNSYDGVIVGLGSNIEASIMTVLNLIDLDCHNIIAKARDEKHRRILLALGLSENQIIIPDRLAGKMIGTRAVFDIDIDIDLHSIDDEFISTTLTVANPDIIGKTLQDAGLSSTKDFNIIQIRRKGKTLLPDDYTELKEQDDVVVFAKITVINGLAEKIQSNKESEEDVIPTLFDFDELNNGENSNVDENLFDNLVFEEDATQGMTNSAPKTRRNKTKSNT